MTLTERLAHALKSILDMVGRHTVRHHALSPLALLIWARFNRTRAGFEKLHQRWQTNTLPKPRARSSQPRAKRATPAPATTIPTSRYWLRKIFPDTAHYSGQIETLLNDPETRELLAAAPQAGRLLRPLARMFGLEIPEHLRLPRKVPSSRALAKRSTLVRAVAAKPDRTTPHRSSSPLHLRLQVPGIKNA